MRRCDLYGSADAGSRLCHDRRFSQGRFRAPKELMAEPLRTLRPCVSLSYYTQRRRVRREVIVGKLLPRT